MLTPTTVLRHVAVPEAVSPTTIVKKCGVKTSLKRQKCHIQKPNLELLYMTGI